MIDDELNPFITSDTPLAAYMHLKGMTLLSTIPDKANGSRKVYVFVDEPERPRYEAEWHDDYGSFRSYWKSLKIVKAKLYE